MVSHILLCGIRLVSGSGDVKLTKDGNVLLHEMVKHYAAKSLIILFLNILKYVRYVSDQTNIRQCLVTLIVCMNVCVWELASYIC